MVSGERRDEVTRVPPGLVGWDGWRGEPDLEAGAARRGRVDRDACRRGARRSSLAIASPSPVPPAGAPGARQKRSKTRSRSSGADARAGVLDGDVAAPRERPDDDPDRGVARAVPDRVVERGSSRAGAAAPGRRPPASGSGRPRSARPRRPPAWRARRRPPRRRRRGGAGRARGSRRPESERASRSRSSTSVGEVLRPRRRCRRARRRPRRPVASALPAQVLHGAPDDGQRRAQLVARVGGELALPAEGGALRGERVADRHERAARVDGAEARRRRGRPRARRTTSTSTRLSSVRTSAVRSWTTWTKNRPCEESAGTVSWRTGTSTAVAVPEARTVIVDSRTSRPELAGGRGRARGRAGPRGLELARADRRCRPARSGSRTCCHRRRT